MIKIGFLLAALVLAASLPDLDKVSAPPGMPSAVIYSGFLATGTPGRQIHYVYVQADRQNYDNLSLAVWLNGGPGCSSLIGMLTEVGPFMVGNAYKLGDMLKKNDYSWGKAANLLFLESPAIVGFSNANSTSYQWTDEETARDAFAALKDFIFSKAPQFSNRTLYLTGESYAGKYIPDLVSLIISNNRDSAAKYINLKGIMVGNGVMNFLDNALQKSQVQYMMDHDLLSNRIMYIHQHACKQDFNSPRCKFARYQIGYLQVFLNKYNIYETCKRSSQANRLLEVLYSKQSKRTDSHIYRDAETFGEIPECPSDQGLMSYWNLNKYAYHVENITKMWAPCARLNYSVSLRGSMKEYRDIISNGAIRVWLFSGDFDDQVPFTDTEANVQTFRLPRAGGWSSWNVVDQHGGFYQVYDNNFTLITVKGAGHMVPTTQPRSAFQLFYNFVNGKGVNNQIFSDDE